MPRPGHTLKDMLDFYECKHVSNSKASDVMSDFDEHEISLMKSKIKNEYEIYNELLKYKFI